MEKCVTDRYALFARSSYDDALKMYKAKEFILSLDCCRRALWEVVAALNAVNGCCNLKEKWISKLFIDNKAYGNEELLEDYLAYQIYSCVPKDNLENYVENFLEVIQNFINILGFSLRR